MSKKAKIFLSSVAFLLALSLTLGLVLFLPKKEEKPTVQPPQESRGYVPIHAEIVSAAGDTGASTAPSIEKGGITYVSSGVTYTMSGGRLANHKAKYGGAVYVASGGTFIMNAGIITGCQSEYGGAIYVEDGGFCYLNGGSITGNTSQTAAIYVESGGTVEMADSAIVHDNVKLEPKNINIYVDDALIKTISSYSDYYIVNEADMPLSYEECCGYFLNQELTKTIKNDTIDLSNGDVNIYTKTAIVPSEITFALSSDKTYYSMDMPERYVGWDDFLPRTVIVQSTTDLVMPKNYNGLPVKALHENCTTATIGLEIKVTSFVFNDVVETIGSISLAGTEITYINLPDSVTSIGEWAFRQCSGLKSIVVGEGNSVYDSRNNCNALIETSTGTLIQGCKNTDLSQTTSITSIGEWAFDECDGLTSIEIPDSVTRIGDRAFYNCSGLTSIEIPDSVTSIGGSVFYNCSGLKSVTIGNSVESIGSYAFESCSGLTSIEIPDSVTSIGSYAFRYCSGLTSIEIPDSVTSIGSEAFRSCRGLTSIEIPNSVTSIAESAFYYCRGLTSVEIPDSVTSIGNQAFYYCEGLTSIYIPSSVKTITASYNSSPFYYCSSTMVIYCGATSKPTGWSTYWNNYSSSRTLQVVWGKTREEYEAAIAPAVNINVYVDGDLSKTIEAKGYTYIIVEADMPLSYEECCGYFLNEELTKTIKNDTIDLSNGDVNIYTKTAIVPSEVKFALSSDKTYYSMDMPEFAAGWDFLPRTVIVQSTTDLVMPKNYNGLPVKALQENRTTEVIGGLEIKVTSFVFNDVVETIGRGAFAYTEITYINLPDSVTSIGEYVFYNCSGISSIVVGEDNSVYDSRNNCNALIETSTGILIQGCNNTDLSQTTEITSIGSEAFRYCIGLTSIEIPDSVESIGERAFSYCSGLTSIYIPTSVTTISASSNYNYSLFNSCSSTMVIYCGAASKPTGWGSYWNYYNSSRTLQVVWGKTREEYEAAIGASTFAPAVEYELNADEAVVELVLDNLKYAYVKEN